MAVAQFNWIDLSKYNKKIVICLNEDKTRSFTIIGQIENGEKEKLEKIGFKETPVGTFISDITDMNTIKQNLKEIYPEMKILSEGDKCFDGSEITKSRFLLDLSKPDVRIQWQNELDALNTQNHTDLEEDAFSDLSFGDLLEPEEANNETTSSISYSPELMESIVRPINFPENDEFYNSVLDYMNKNNNAISEDMANYIRANGRNLFNNLSETLIKKTRANSLYELNGVRYTLFDQFRNGEYGADVERQDKPASAYVFLRGENIDQRMNLMLDFATTLDSSVVRGHDFRNYIRVIYGLDADSEIPSDIMKEARDLLTISISRMVTIQGSAKTLDKWRRMNRLTDNNAVQATMPPTIPMAVIRSLAIEQFNPDDRNIFVRGDNTGFLSIAPSNLTSSLNAYLVSDPSRVNVLRRMYREAGIDGARVVPSNAYTGGQPQGSVQIIMDSNGSTEEIESILNQRKAEGRSVFILPYDSLSQDSLKNIAENYKIDSLIDINFPMPGADDRSYKATIFEIGDKRPEPYLEPVENYIDRRTINNNSSLWTWAASVVATRGNTNDMEEENQDNEYQTPYSPMSRLHESATMVPKNLMAPILESQNKVLKVANGDVDQFVATALNKTKEEIKEFLSSEQIDGIATGLMRFQREKVDGDGVLIADDTGIGKGRECCALGAALVHRGDRLVYMTEYGSSFSDVWREFRTIGASQDIRPFMLNNERIYAESGEVIMEPTPRHIVTGATSRSHWPDGSPMRFVMLSRSEASRLKKHFHHVLNNQDEFTPEDIEQALFIKDVLRGRQITLLNDEQLPGIVDHEEIKEDFIETPSYNVLFSSYSQVNKSSLEDQKRKKNKVRNDKSQFLVDVFEKQTEDNPLSIVLDEAHNAASNTSNMGKNIQRIKEVSKSIVYSTATWSKGVRSLMAYSRLFSAQMNIAQISEIMNAGGTTTQETLTRLMVSEGSYIRRELDSSRCEFENYIDEENKERNIQIVDSVAPVLSAIAVMGGEIDAKISILNRAREAEREIIARENNGVEVQAKMFSTSPFGTSLSQFSRILSRSMALDGVVKQALKSLENNEKPVIALESTLERFVTQIKNEHENPLYIPDIKDYLKYMLNNAVKVKTPEGKVLSIVEEDFERDVVDDSISTFISNIPECMKISEEVFDLEEKEQNIKNFLEENGYPDVRSYLLDLMDQSITSKIADVFTSGKELDDEAVMRIWNMSTEALKNYNYSPDNILGFVEFANEINEHLPMNPARLYKQIIELINEVPDLPVSAIDYIKQSLKDKGYSVGEITGRSVEIVNGELVPRIKEPKGIVKDKFNRGEYDAAILNSSGATAIDMHAGSRFTDQRKRNMIFAEDLRDPQKDKQMRGRVNRFDQVDTPKFTTCMTGMPVEIRRFIMQNSKSRCLSASVTANRENAHLQHDIPDIINKVGDIVAARYLLANKETAEILGLKNTVIALEFKLSESEVDMNDISDDDSDVHADINQLIARIESLLPYHEQTRAMREIESEYAAYIEELNAIGANPLLVKHIPGEWSCRPEDRKLISGIESENNDDTTQDSIMNTPLYMEKGKFTRRVVANSIRSGRLMSMIEKNQSYLGEETPDVRAKELWDLRNHILKDHMPLDNMANVEDLVNGEVEVVGVISPILKQGFHRLENLCSTLEKLQLGSTLTVKEGKDMPVKLAVITDIKMPDINDKRINMPSFYEIFYLTVGDERPRSMRLSSVMLPTDNFSVEFHKNSGFNSNNPEDFMTLWDEESKKAGFNSTYLSRLLVGNEWQAVSMMVNGKFGRVVTYDTSDGVQRAIEITQPDKFEKMPLNIETPQLAYAVLCETRKLEMGGLLVSKTKSDAGEYSKMSLPSPTGRFSWMHENQNIKDEIFDIIRSTKPDMTDEDVNNIWNKSVISKNKIILNKIPDHKLTPFFSIMMKAGTPCTVENSMGDKVNEIRNRLRNINLIPNEEIEAPANQNQNAHDMAM